MRAWLKTIVLVLLLFRMIPGSTAGEATPRSRPDPESGATTVRVGLYVLDITKIDNIDQSFTADCILRLRWADPRVGEAGARIALTDVWHPNVGIYNLRSHEEMFDESVVVLRDNVVQYTQRYYGDFSSVFDFHRFPFDVQSLPITLISFGNRPEEVELVIDAVGREERFSIPGWMIEQPRGEVSTIQADLLAGSSERIERPRLDFRLDARRYLDYYWWKVMIPLSIILMLSWAVFWIDPTQTGPQIAVSATSILTMIAFLLRLEAIIPPVSYLTRLDRLVFACLSLLFLAYIEALVTARLASSQGRRGLAITMDRWSRTLFPVAYGIILIVFWMG